jgi:very-short-patch-repair endonuclease
MVDSRAKQLRQQPTDAEAKLWSRLRYKQLDGFRFRRQAPIGPYIVDFFCPTAKLIVEVDGGQHADKRDYDERRTEWLEERGYRVLRFWNNDVLENIEGVLAEIQRMVKDSPPS